MKSKLPKTKLARGLATGKTAVGVSREAIKYLAKKPFLNNRRQRQAKVDFEQNSAEILFKGMTLLRGTALKIAQSVSMESDILPEAVRKELEKSYHQVPPMNRALVRRSIQTAFGSPPEDVFKSFEMQAFAAASLGQVHRAVSKTGAPLAVKVQYPGISHTIKSDIQLVNTLFRPLPEYELIRPVIKEVEKRLLEEINYHLEADHAAFFTRQLRMPGIQVPVVHRSLSNETVLTLEHLPGPTLNEWLGSGPPQAARDRVAQALHDLFLYSLYEVNTIHADPNPGNFIIGDDLTVGLLDFGCVKRLSPSFVKLYQQLWHAMERRAPHEYRKLFAALGFMRGNTPPAVEKQLFSMLNEQGVWLSRLMTSEAFDFTHCEEFIQEGRGIMQKMLKLRNHMELNPHFVFLARTRFGLMRLFGKMEARVRIRNAYEWPSTRTA